MPEPIAAIAFQNKKVLYDILFHASAATLRTIAAKCGAPHLAEDFKFGVAAHGVRQARCRYCRDGEHKIVCAKPLPGGRTMGFESGVVGGYWIVRGAKRSGVADLTALEAWQRRIATGRPTRLWRAGAVFAGCHFERHQSGTEAPCLLGSEQSIALREVKSVAASGGVGRRGAWEGTGREGLDAQHMSFAAEWAVA